jgi:hypothetical protein
MCRALCACFAFFLLLLVAGRGLAVTDPTSSRYEPPLKTGSVGDGATLPRTGGEDITTATVIPSLPYSDTGATCGFQNDYSDCVQDTGAPDVVYSFLPPTDMTVDVNLCGSGYDTALYIYEAGGGTVACNDDYCALQSEVDGVALTAGVMYYIVVDGFAQSCGSYSLSVREAVPCDLTCPAGGQQEGEPPCVDGYVDWYNGGCQYTGWTEIPAQEGDCATFCGKGCTYLYQGSSYRDDDWLTVTAAGGPVTATCTAEYPVQLILFRVADCITFDYLLTAAPRCQPAELTWDFSAGTEVWILGMPVVFNGVPESDYVLDICGITDPRGACCRNGVCTITYGYDCDGPNQVWLGSGSTCDPNPCNTAGACCLPSGQCQQLTGADCYIAGGTWHPDVPCDPDPCGAVPVQRTSWGTIKNTYR